MNDELPTPTLTPPEKPISAPKNKRFQKITNWIKKHRTKSLIIGGTLLVAAASATAFAAVQLYPIPEPVVVPKPTPKPEPEPEPEYYSPLTGKKVKNEAATEQAVTAIMIENSPDARPQSGLKNSGIVYEAIAEAGITRFLVLYQQEKPQLIGPVRSLRTYYVDWLAPYNASVAHVGGSKFSLDEIRNGTYRDIDQFFNASTYWRSSDRYPPHNVYTSFKNIDKLNQQKDYTTSDFTGFSRKDSKASETPEATSINITMSSPTFNSSYKYDKSSNTYLRSQGGAPHVDREAGQIAPRVAIVIKADIKTVMEDGWRENIQTTGSGPAYIFQDGTVQEVSWHKATRKTQLSFADSKGNDVPLARGQTWITVVPSDTGGVSWQ